MDEMIPFAEQLIIEHGRFFPFGGKMLKSGKVVHVAVYNGDESSDPSRLIEMMRSGFRHEAGLRDLKATAIVSNVATMPPGALKRKQTLQIDLNHRDDYRMSIFLPYEIEDGKVRFDPIFATGLDFDPFEEG